MKSTRLLIGFLLLGLGSSAHGQSSEFMRCRIQRAGIQAVFILDALGVGTLKLTRGEEKNDCTLKLVTFEDARRAMAPRIAIEFERGQCSGDLGVFDKELRQEISIDLQLKSMKIGNDRGYVNWLRSHQPEYCEIEKIDMSLFEVNVSKWRNGIWGRGVASPRK